MVTSRGVKTTEGLLEMALPQLRVAEKPFYSYLAQAFGESSDILKRIFGKVGDGRR